MIGEIVHAVVKVIRGLGIPLDIQELGYIIPLGKGESMNDQVLTMPEFVEGLELAMKYGITHTDLSKWKHDIENHGKEKFMSFPHKLGVGAGNCGAGYIFEDSMEKIFKKEAEKWVYIKTPSIDTSANCKYLPYCDKCVGFEMAFRKHLGWMLYGKK